MFDGCSKLTTIFASDKFSTAKVTSSDGMFTDCTELVGAKAYDANYTDASMANYDGYFSQKKAWAEYDGSTQTLTFKTGTVKPESTGDVTVYDLNEGASSPEWLYKINATNVVFDQSFSDARPTSCCEWFSEQYSLTSIKGLEYLNTEEVTSMSRMFSCSSLESLDLSNFDTKNVTDMSDMFANCTALEVLDLSNFNTGNVTYMYGMFQNCSKLTTIFVSDKFSTAKVDDSNDMFLNCELLAGAKAYDERYTDVIMANYDGYFSQKKAWAEYDSSTETLTFKTGTVKPESDETVTVYELNEGDNQPRWFDNMCESVVFDKSFSSARPTSCYAWFDSQGSLTSITGLEYLNTEKVTDMGYMFCSCSSLGNLDVSNFNTENVTSMENMFSGCSSLGSLDVSNFNTESVTNMSGMFFGCASLQRLDLSNFNTAKVTNMEMMFSNCSSLESLNVSKFNTENVTDMGGMFDYCKKLKEPDLSNFNTAKVTMMSCMFEGCSELTTIYASDKFDVTNVKSSDNMFLDCTALVGAVGYSASNTNDHTMANYKTGYFKTYYKVGETKTELCGENLSVENLTLEGDKDLVVNAPFTATNVSYSRPMTSKWGTLCLPFEVEATETASTKYYKLESVGTDEITLTQLSGKIAAGTPMLVNSTDGDGNAANISISASSVEVGATPADGDQAGGWQLVGSFAETEVPDDGYIISKNKFWLVSDLKENVSGTKSVKTKAMRAWLKPSAENAEAKAHVLSIAIDDENETTAVDAIEALTEDTAEIYDLQGRRLNSLQKGLNIVKTGNVTRKIMVK
jgi:surface protein